MSARRLLALLAEPWGADRVQPAEWDRLVRIARMGSVASTLHARLEDAGMLSKIPAPVARQLGSERTLAEYRIRMTAWSLAHLEQVLGPLHIELVLLKGSAYVAQQASWSRGRMVSDVDLLVRAGEIGRAERALHAAGWGFGEIDDYDERYYREWSHELPPLLHPERPLAVDLHHTILPVTSRLSPDADALVNESVPIAGSAFRALSRPDQLLHTCCHLFEDSDMWQQMRDLLDLDAMLRETAGDAAFAGQLQRAATHHGLQRPLYYGLRYAARFTATPLPQPCARAMEDAAAPTRPVAALMDALVSRSLLPASPDRPCDAGRRWAKRALKARHLARRFPARLLLRHLGTKLLRAAG